MCNTGLSGPEIIANSAWKGANDREILVRPSRMGAASSPGKGLPHGFRIVDSCRIRRR